MHDATQSAKSLATARKQKILARGQQRIQSITFGGDLPQEKDTSTDLVSRTLTYEGAKSEDPASVSKSPTSPDGTPRRWLTLQSPHIAVSTDRPISDDPDAKPPSLESISKRLKPAHSASLQPISSPLQAMRPGRRSEDSDNDLQLPSPSAAEPSKTQAHLDSALASSEQTVPTESMAGAWPGGHNIRASKGSNADNEVSVAAEWDTTNAASHESCLKHAVAATAGVRAVISVVLAAVMIALSAEIDEPEPYHNFESRLPLLSATSPVLGRLTAYLTAATSSQPPLLLLLAVNMAFIIAAYFLWDKQYARAAAQRAKQRGAPGVVQRLLQLAAPRLYAVVATYLPLTWTLWQDVAVYALAAAFTTFLLGPHLEQHRRYIMALPLHPQLRLFRQAAERWTL